MTEERWLPVVEFEGFYEVSNMGRVRSIPRTEPVYRSDGSTWYERAREGRLLNAARTKNGYLRVNLKKNGVQSQHLVHRLVLSAFRGAAPDESWYACHNNGERTDNRLPNLRWATPQSNQADRKKHGTHQCGENAAPARLTERQALQIIFERRAGKTLSDVARQFGVSFQQVSKIARGECWKHLHAQLKREETCA